MKDYKALWKDKITAALVSVAAEIDSAITVDASALVAEVPPKSEMGDLGFPLFAFAKPLKKGPPQIAQAVAAKLPKSDDGEAKAIGPYVNIFLNRRDFSRDFLDDSLDEKKSVARGESLAGQKIMVEFSSPNTNKPLHLGHLRNDALGESCARILAAAGAEVRRVSIINDRGVHICKSMLAYMKHGEGKTPESEGKKSDHFVGDWYVKYNQMEKDDPACEGQAQELLRKWEAGDAETVALWKKMNGWALDGMKETYARTDVHFDKFYFESDTYLIGRDEVLKGLEKGLFYRDADGAVWADLTADGLDKKILLRKDGTSVYMTQDFGTAIMRHNDWPFDRQIYVVGSEQNYHFQVLFILLKRIGLEWAKNCYHLSYGMVNLPEGKMKSREGTVVDADDLIDSLRDMALAEMKEKERVEAVADAALTAEKIAIGALHYFLLQTSPARDMLFDPKESLSFNGNTGPYLQYSCARISSMLAKAGSGGALNGTVKAELLASDAEWELVKAAAGCVEAIEAAAASLDPSILTAWLYQTAKAFSRFYHDCPILNATDAAGKPDADLAATRLALSKAVLRIMKESMALACIPFIDAM